MNRRRVVLFVAVLLTGCDPAPAPAPAPSADARTAGDHRATIAVGGVERAYLLHAPAGYVPGQPARPLVIALHHRPGNAEAMRATTRLDAKADQEGFLVAYPEGVGGQFNAFGCCGVQDDVGFVSTLAAHLVDAWQADPDRVYLAGASNGADLAFRAAAETSGVFAAIAPVSGGFEAGRPLPQRAVSVVTFIGTADPQAQAFQAGLTAWRDGLHCAPGPARTTGDPAVRQIGATCGDGSTVEVYLVEGAGHVWFGAKTGELADPGPKLDATDVLWDFFEAHPRRR